MRLRVYDVYCMSVLYCRRYIVVHDWDKGTNCLIRFVGGYQSVECGFDPCIGQVNFS